MMAFHLTTRPRLKYTEELQETWPHTTQTIYSKQN